MGNLCSSGTDRTEKKEEKQLPKSKDGEDEALLSKTGEAADNGKDQQGLSGILGGVVDSGEAAVSDAVGTAQAHGKSALEGAESVVSKADIAVEAGKDAAVEGMGNVVADLKESAEQKASNTVDDVNNKLETGQNKMSGLTGDVKSMTDDVSADVQGRAADVQSDVSRSLESGQQQAEALTSGLTNEAKAVREESVSTFENSKNEAVNMTSRVEDGVVETSSSGLLDTVKQTVQDKADEVKDVAQEKGQEVKETAEDYLSQAVQSAKDSAIGSFTSAKETASGEMEPATAGAEIPSNQFAENAAQNQIPGEEIQSSVSDTFQSAAFGVISTVNEGLSDQKGVQEASVDSSIALDALASDMSSTMGGVKAEVTVDDLPPPPPPPPFMPEESEQSESKPGLFDSFGAVATGAVSTGVGFVGEKIVDGVQGFTGGKDQRKEEVDESVVEASQQSVEESPAPIANNEGTGLMGSFGSAASGAVQSGVGVVSEKIVGKVQDFFGGDGEKDATAEQTPAEPSGGSVDSSHMSALADQMVDKSQDLMFGSDTKVETAEELVMQSQAPPDVASMPPESPEEGECFLTKAKSLLQHHRNSLDGGKVSTQAVGMINEAFNDNNNEEEEDAFNASVQADESNNIDAKESIAEEEGNSGEQDKAREEIAREFVEDIIDKATNIVSDTMATKEEVSGEELLASPDMDPCVDHAEETLEPKKRGVCFASPNTSASASFSSLSSPPEIISPSPAVVPDSDLSPNPSDASSISQGELVERDDIELELPPPRSTTPPHSSTSMEEGDGEEEEEEEECRPTQLDDFDDSEVNVADVGASTTAAAADDDNLVLDNRQDESADKEENESLQRIAMAVTSKAVQDAIKIVTDNGTGGILTTNDNNANNNNNNNNNNNSVNVNVSELEAISSPSSGDQEEEEEEEEVMTTTDSSQVERGSSVSDLTDTSQQGSIADSLSSYDPGAVYRQDLTDLSTDVTAISTGAADFGDTNASSAATASASVASGLEPLVTDNTAVTGDSGSAAETPTPTNQSSFADAYSQNQHEQQQQQHEPPHQASEEVDGVPDDLPPPPPSPPSSEVPSTFPAPLHGSGSCGNHHMSKQPTIVINSPDSAPNTSGSLEDVSASPTSEALI